MVSACSQYTYAYALVLVRGVGLSWWPIVCGRGRSWSRVQLLWEICKIKDIPEEQHTGGIVEVLGRVIVVACLRRKVHELRDREVALRQVLPTPN
jgi:hypothetical protein